MEESMKYKGKNQALKADIELYAKLSAQCVLVCAKLDKAELELDRELSSRDYESDKKDKEFLERFEKLFSEKLSIINTLNSVMKRLEKRRLNLDV